MNSEVHHNGKKLRRVKIARKGLNIDFLKILEEPNNGTVTDTETQRQTGLSPKIWHLKPQETRDLPKAPEDDQN